MRMQSDETFRVEVAAMLLEIAALTEEHIDVLVKKAQRAKKK